MNKNVIEVSNVSFSYDQQEAILKSISFSITKGELVAVIGHNGSGKTTLIKLLTKTLQQQKGSIKCKGKLAYIPQKYNQDPNFPATVEELLNLECCACSYRDDVVNSLGLSKLSKKQFKYLSGGQQQRVFIALALLSNPDVLILDEPTVGVDTQTQEEFYKLLKRLNKEYNLTILLITHDTGMISQYFSTILCVSNKSVHIDKAENTQEILKHAYGDSFHQIHHHHH